MHGGNSDNDDDDILIISINIIITIILILVIRSVGQWCGQLLIEHCETGTELWQTWLVSWAFVFEFVFIFIYVFVFIITLLKVSENMLLFLFYLYRLNRSDPNSKPCCITAWFTVCCKPVDQKRSLKKIDCILGHTWLHGDPLISVMQDSNLCKFSYSPLLTFPRVL